MLFDVEGMNLFIVGNVNISRRIFLVGKLVNFWLLAGILPGIVLGDIPAGHCFVFKVTSATKR